MGKFSVFLFLPQLCCLIWRGHGPGNWVNSFSLSGKRRQSRDANGSGKTRSGNYLKMTPNYQCKVSWYRLPKANIPHKVKTKGNTKKPTKKMKIQTFTYIFVFRLLPVTTWTKFADIRFLFRVCSPPTSFLPDSCWWATLQSVCFREKGISSTRIWLTLSQHSWAFGPKSGLWHRCYQRVFGVWWSVYGRAIRQTFGGILEDNVFVSLTRSFEIGKLYGKITD